jgi:hypothetical protein
VTVQRLMAVLRQRNLTRLGNSSNNQVFFAVCSIHKMLAMFSIVVLLIILVMVSEGLIRGLSISAILVVFLSIICKRTPSKAEENMTNKSARELPMMDRGIGVMSPLPPNVRTTEPVPLDEPSPPSIMTSNAELVEAVMNPRKHTVDDLAFERSIAHGKKDKQAKEIRSHWNNNNWKKYFDYELSIHEDSNREWWGDDDAELSRKHVLI